MSGENPRRTQGVRPSRPLTVDEIVTTAIRLIEERGAAAFSVVQLAERLCVTPSAVYWHVGDRAALVSLIAHRWMELVVPPPTSATWGEALIRMAYAYRAAALGHPDIARLVAVEVVRGPSSEAVAAAVVEQLERGGLSPDRIVHAFNALLAATVGFIVLELGRDEPDRIRHSGAGPAADERFPALAGHRAQLDGRLFSIRPGAIEASLDESFGYLVNLVVEGLAR